MKLILLILTIFSVEYLSANIANKEIAIKESKVDKELLRDRSLYITIFNKKIRYSRPPREVRITRKSRSVAEVQHERIVSFRKKNHKMKKIHLLKDISSHLDNNLLIKEKS